MNDTWYKWCTSLPEMKDPADPITLLAMCGYIGHEPLSTNYWDLMQGSLHIKSLPRRRRKQYAEH